MRYLFPLLLLFRFALAGTEPLPVKDVFKPQAEQRPVNGAYQTAVTIHFPPGYYLYADRTVLSGVQGKQTRTPPIQKNDPYLGPTAVWETPPTITVSHHKLITQLTLKAQGCQTGVICYPPTTWTLAVPAPLQATAPAATTVEIPPFSATAGKRFFAPKGAPVLSEEQVFQITPVPAPDNHLQINYQVPPGYYLYRNSLKADIDGQPLPTLPLPAGEIYQDKFLGKQEIYRHDFSLNAALPALSPGKKHVLTLFLQGCAENRICYPPLQRRFSLPDGLPLPDAALKATESLTDKVIPAQNTAAAPDSAATGTKPENTGLNNDAALKTAESPADKVIPAQNTVAAPDSAATDTNPENTGLNNDAALKTAESSADKVIPAQNTAAAPDSAATGTNPKNTGFDIERLNRHFFLTLPLLLLLGIGVSFTACVYPLIPIVTSLVVGKNTGAKRAYALIATYIIAMGAAMALLGAVFAAFAVNLQVVLQKPWIAVLIALLFVALSLSLFDVYTLQTPRFLRRPLDSLTRRQHSGSYLGAAVMGAVSVLVVSPCATPILTALLLFSTQTTPVKGATALFVFGFGTGLPLFLFAGAFRRFMPKTGIWSEAVKKAFAFALLAIAVYLISRIMPLGYAQGLWAAYALLIAVFLYASDAGKIRLYAAGAAFIIAIALGIQSSQSLSAPFSSPRMNTSTETAPPIVKFRYLDTLEQIETAVAASNRPVWLDFYADWCTACKAWEKNIWHNPRFAPTLSRDTLLKVDVTDFNKKHRQMFQRLGIVGPPAVFYYPAHGNIDTPSKQIIGEMTAEEFAVLLKEQGQNKL